jgi:predicted dehydrogenase
VSRLRVGVVGAGVGRMHVDGYLALPDLYEVAALCDLDAERRLAVADAADIPERTGRLEDLFGLDLDVIDLCTPSALHFEQATAVLEAGINVVIEKPVARSLAEVDALIATEARSGKRACPVFQYRFGHGIQKLHHLIAMGVAGPPSVATAETHWYRGRPYYAEAPWRGRWDTETGGCFTTHAIHIHDLLCEVLGPVASVHARSSNRLNGNETEDMGVISLGFESGAFATSSVTLGSCQQTSRLRFCFRDLVAESALDPYKPGHDPWTFSNDDPDAAAVIDAALTGYEPLPERFTGQFYRLHAALTGDAPLPVTLADARRSIELLTAAYWSSRTGEAVPLPIGPDHPFYAGWLDTMKKDTAHG